MDNRETIAATRKTLRGFMPVLRWQGAHINRINVRRITHDQIELPGRQSGEQIRTHHLSPLRKTVTFDVAPRQSNGRWIDIGQRQMTFGKGECAGNPDAARTAAQIQNARR